MAIDRRRFLGTGMAGAAALSAPAAIGAARPRAVVVGGGAGGGTAARHIAEGSGGAIDVTLIEPTRTYYTCFFSNLYIGGFRTLASIGHGYGHLAAAYGINVVHDMAVGIDRDAKEVALASGPRVPYDRLVVAPGIDFRNETVPGYSVAAQNRMPHAWKAGSQTALISAQIAAMPEGGVFVMVPPPNPYRCPPGPYERISMIAHRLKQTNPTAKILILDPKEKFSKQGLFEEGWEAHYGGMVEWLPFSEHGGIERVDPETMEIETAFDSVTADAANVIPGQKAGWIAEAAGLTDNTAWCPIEADSMRSTMDEAVYVLGDATLAGDMPKSGFSANSQAEVAALSIQADLTNSDRYVATYANVCWSMISPDNSVKIGASYAPAEGKIAKTQGFVSQTGESVDLRRETYRESVNWYASITEDIFG